MASPIPWPVDSRVDLAYRGPPAWRGSCWHTPPQVSVWLLERGSVSVQIGGVRLRAASGQLLVLPPFVRRLQTFSDDARIASVGLRLVASDGSVALPGFDARVWQAASQGALVSAQRALIDAVASLGGSRPDEPPLAARLRLRAAADQCAASLLAAVAVGRAPAPGDARVAAAAELLRRRHGQRAVPWSELSALTGLSRAQLDRLFRSELGATPKRVLDDACLQRAITALSDAGRPLKTIAAELGFGDASHFSKWFAQRLGQSPGTWRRRQRRSV